MSDGGRETVGRRWAENGGFLDLGRVCEGVGRGLGSRGRRRRGEIGVDGFTAG